MDSYRKKEQLILEVCLIIVCLGLTTLFYTIRGYRMVTLHLFFLPVALAGFYLGRYRAGILALFCVICASVATAARLTDVTGPFSPSVIVLGVAVWAAAMGLVALLVGTISDDRAVKMEELHEAYVGVVEVLSQYLQSAHPRLKAQSVRVAELSQAMAVALRLSPKEIDDIRVASLLYHVGRIEITTKVIRRAVDAFEGGQLLGPERTLQGMDLMLSLGAVLSGAIPLLLNQGEDSAGFETQTGFATGHDVPIGARIIRIARNYCSLTDQRFDQPRVAPPKAVAELRRSCTDEGDADILSALESVLSAQDYRDVDDDSHPTSGDEPTTAPAEGASLDRAVASVGG